MSTQSAAPVTAAEDPRLRYHVGSTLIESAHPAIAYQAQRDLLNEDPGPIEFLWNLPECRRILARQRPDGSWRYPGGYEHIRSRSNYDQLETYRQLGVLVAKFGMERRHAAIRRAARFLLSFQTGDGDFRGIYGNQFTPNYTAAITELLIKAGYQSRPDVNRSMRWLMSMRQDDGGWAIPLRTRGRGLDVISMNVDPIEPDRSKPSSHLITGIVLRALASHPTWKRSEVARCAGEVLASRFFKPDTYSDHRPASHWTVFSYPFWWTDLLSALDSLFKIGFDPTQPGIASGLAWFYQHQQRNGMWQTGHNRPKSEFSDEWVALAVCRLLKAAARTLRRPVALAR